jgi:hypothetical protein
VFHREKVLSGQGRSKEELLEVDRYLISSEENLSSLRFESSDAPTQLKMALHLVAMKDRALHSLCSDLLKDLGVDYIEQAKDSDNNLSDLCSGELAQLFTLFRTFKTIGRMVSRRVLNNRYQIACIMHVVEKDRDHTGGCQGLDGGDDEASYDQQATVRASRQE